MSEDAEQGLTEEDLKKAARKMPWYGWVFLATFSGGGGTVVHQAEKVCEMVVGRPEITKEDKCETMSCCTAVSHMAQQCAEWKTPE